MICSKCGANVNNGSLFCTSCGAKMDAPAPVPDVPVAAPPVQQNYGAGYQQSAPVQPNYQNTQYQQPMPMPVYTNPMPDTTPIKPIGYVGYMLLFSIPTIGLIMMFVYAFGSNTNINVKNLARAYLIMQLIAVALVVISWIIIGIMGVSLMNLAGGTGSY